MLRPEKRRCLQKALGTRGGRRGKRTARGAALPPPPAYSDNDSDVQLVQDVAGTSATPPSQRRRPEGTSSKPATAGAQQLEPEQQARLMRAQHQLAQLKQQAELDCELESDSEGVDCCNTGCCCLASRLQSCPSSVLWQCSLPDSTFVLPGITLAAVDPSPPKLQSKMPAAGTQQRQQQQPAAVGSGSGDELAGPAAGGDGKIVLKVQSSHGCRSLRMGRTDPFSKLMHAYLTHAIQEVGAAAVLGSNAHSYACAPAATSGGRSWPGS